MLGLLLDGEAVALPVELGHAIALGVVDPVSEDGGLGILLCRTDGLAQHLRESGAVEDVVAQHEAYRIVADELAPYDEGLREPVGRRLLGIGEAHTEIAPVAKQTLESGQVLRGGDDEYLSYPRLHQRGKGIIDHRLVKNRQHLLGYSFGYRI